MSDMTADAFSVFPSATQPNYATPSANSPITLFDGDMTLRCPEGVARGIGKLELNWLPQPTIRFRLESVTSLHDAFVGHLEVPRLGVSFDVEIWYMDSDSARTLYRGRPMGRITKGNDKSACDCIVFHLPNFMQTLGGVVRSPGASGIWKGRVNFEDTEWRIVIDQNKDAQDLIQQLRDEGGFALTHTGRVTRLNGEQIAFEAATNLLDCLTFFFSFLRGAWCGPTLAVAQVSGETVWELWERPWSSAWQSSRTWFPSLDPSAIQDVGRVFGGFTRRWSETTWTEPLRYAIHWYVESNLQAGGLEGAVVLTQTALELLGWLILVEDPATKQVPITRFNSRLHADERIRLLLAAEGIPTAIPSTLVSLAQTASTIGAKDGPSALIEIRNAIVHPKPTHRKTLSSVSEHARLDAWNLGLWYLELTLLHLFQYDGVYFSRLRTGFPADLKARVPWS